MKQPILALLSVALLVGGSSSAASQGGPSRQAIAPAPQVTGPIQGVDADPGNPVANTLNMLGIATSPTPREDEQGNDLDESYTPLGGAVTLNRTDELLMLGLDLPGDDGQGSFFLFEDAQATSRSGEFGWDLFFQGGPNEFEDTQDLDLAAGHQSFRAATGGDVDGDGLEEVLVLYRSGAEIRLRTIEDASEGHAVIEQVIAVEPLAGDVAVAAGDFTGNGKAEIAVAWGVDGVHTSLSLLRLVDGAYQVLATRLNPPTDPNADLSVALESGNVDNDFYAELILVVNERSDYDQATTSWQLFDDARSGGDPLIGGPHRATIQGVEHTAEVADVSLGDVDGDGRDEIVLAGLTSVPFDYCQHPTYLVRILDDGEHGFEELGATQFTHAHNGCWEPTMIVRWAEVNTGDFDGDGREEIQMNQWIYDDLASAAPFTVWNELPAETILEDSPSFQVFDSSTAAFAVGDFTGDGLDNVMTVRAGRHDVRVYGLQIPNPDPPFVELDAIDVEAYQIDFNGGVQHPILVTLNADTDSPVLSYSEGDYKFAFTEPIVIAALAAPPYQTGIQQNVEACSTAFGNTTSTGMEEERTVSLSAGVSFGVKFDGGALTQSEAELEQSLTVAASQTTSHSYQLDRTILFQSGWDEDLVVFTTVPMDIWTYTVTSHPDESMVGKPIEIRYPRAPIVLQANRDYYNEHIFEGGMAVDDSIFQHVLGDVSSYPTRSDKDALLATNGGLEDGPHSVGIGSGQTSATIQVSESWGEGGSLEVSYQLQAKATVGGVMAGFTVGASASNSLTLTSGTSTTYTGTVGAIHGDDFPANAYQFGLFTYVLESPDRGYQFEVLNYWVE